VIVEQQADHGLVVGVSLAGGQGRQPAGGSWIAGVERLHLFQGVADQAEIV